MVKVKEDLTNAVFGRLTVLRQADDYIDSKGHHYARWICKCNCENHTITIVNGNALTKSYKPTRSCGCINNEINQIKNLKENKRDLSRNYGVLWTTNTDEEVYFDLEDADIILSHCWYKDAHGYAVTNIRKDDGSRTIIQMHSLLGYYYPDHNDRNKLNNRRENLIQCTASENMTNRNPQSNNTSGIIGVSWHKSRNKWVARINVNRKRINLGEFDDKYSAIRARLFAEKQYCGEFAPQRHLFKQYKID